MQLCSHLFPARALSAKAWDGTSVKALLCDLCAGAGACAWHQQARRAGLAGPSYARVRKYAGRGLDGLYSPTQAHFNGRERSGTVRMPRGVRP